jgi:hypothetical protein
MPRSFTAPLKLSSLSLELDLSLELELVVILSEAAVGACPADKRHLRYT